MGPSGEDISQPSLKFVTDNDDVADDDEMMLGLGHVSTHPHSSSRIAGRGFNSVQTFTRELLPCSLTHLLRPDDVARTKHGEHSQPDHT